MSDDNTTETAVGETAEGERALDPAEGGPAPAAPKQKRTQAKAAPARRAMTPEERHAEREGQRRAKALARRRERERQRGKRRQRPQLGETSLSLAREHGPGRQKTRQGVVVSDKAQKTITVRIDVARRHRRYAKIVRTSTTLHAHDERGEAKLGDTVLVRESRPLSRTKRWRLIEVLERAR
jgi:small subunit ribosomal protein S17